MNLRDDTSTSNFAIAPFHRIHWFWLLVLLWPNPTIANDIEKDTAGRPHRIEPVVVTATRSPLSPQDVAANITVISADQLEKMPATTVAQALTYIPGISVQFNGGPGSDAGDVRIQGSEVHHVSVYQDGVPLNQLVNPRTDLSLLPVTSIERIEIYKGSASSAWGSALGGVVNIITKAPSSQGPLAVKAQGSYGTHRAIKSNARFSGTQNDLDWTLSYTHEQNDGFIENTDYKLDGLHANINYETSDTSRLDLSLTHNQAQNADPVLNWADFSDEPFWDDIERQHTYQRLRFEKTLNSTMMLTMKGWHRQSEVIIEDVFSNRREQFLDYEERLWGTGANLDWRPAADHAIVAGLEANWGRFEWNPTDTPRRSDHISDGAFFASDTVSRGALTINGGARYDVSQDYGSAFSPSLGAVYDIMRFDAVIRCQAAKGFSAPDYAWVHDPTHGNPDLRPEHAINYQLGGDIHPLPWLRAELNLFRADVQDLIRFDDSTKRYQNIEKATRQGFEWALAATSKTGLSMNIGGSHTDTRNDITHTVIDNIPRTQYNMSLNYAKKRASHSLLGKYIDNNSSYPETRDKVFIFDYLLNIKLPTPKMKGQWAIYAAIYNLMNTKYLVRSVWPQPGRWGELGIQFEFDI